ncbi:MAG TPA: hypothetical protein VI749_03360 [Candidatus Omnitrophota bacterium]|nr:hypothetical protein [Candidatus Omnitrophota bacterium]
MNNWRECLIQAEGIRSGELFKFRDLCAKAFQPAKFPKEAAVFSESVFGSDQVKFWVSPVAVQLLEKSGVDLSRWQAKESGPPKRNEAAIPAGHHTKAWDLLPE